MLRSNIIYLALPALLCCALSMLLNHFTRFISSDWWLALSFFVLLCLVFNIVYAVRVSKPDFTGLLVAGIVIRLLFAMVFVFVYSFLERPDIFFHFSTHFILQYVCFTIFEIAYLRRLIHLKAHKA